MHRKWIFDLMIATILCAGSWHGDLIEYGISAAKGQLRIIFNARPIEKFLADNSISDEWKKNVMLIQEIKQFTVDSLGFSPSDNYSKVYDQQGKPLLWVVTGCEEYMLKPKLWWFPVIGRVSYKGFFNREAAEKECEYLEKNGYETRIREVNAWSTLGWFKDPIMTSMLDDAPGDLANLIIHELSHKTIYIKNDVEYSENLASFIGDKGARLFLLQKFGPNSDAYHKYISSTHDDRQFSSHLICGAARLDSLYQSATFKNASEEKKKIDKQQMIASIVKDADTLSLFNKQPYLNMLNKHTPNNAFFVIFMQYHNQQDDFEEEYQKAGGGNLRNHIYFLINNTPSKN